MKMFPFRIRLRVLMFIVSAFYQVSESRKPILLPSSGQIIINEGEALNITCISDRPIIFIFPNNSLDLSIREYLNVREGFHQYNYYKENTILNDTDWYCCIDYFHTMVHSIYKKYFYNSYNSEESWLYVYVKSNKNFFLDENANAHLNAIAGGHVVIPCRTTSPDLKPILINGNKDEINNTKQSFDPRIGFTVRNLLLEDSNSYKCLIETDNKVHASVNYELSVHLNRKLTEPELRIGNIIGNNFHFNCTIIIKMGMQYEIDWNSPQQNNSRRQIKVFEKEIDGNTVLVTSQLMVFNYKDEDFGNYECVVKSGQDIKKTKIFIDNSYADFKPRIEFSSKDNFYKKEESGENVILKIKVNCLIGIDFVPMIGTLQWFNSNGEKIVESPKYYVKHTEKGFIITSSLLITGLNIMDSGNYTLHAESAFSIGRKNFLLDVIGKPISSLTRTETYYPPNESTEFHCEIISNPPPNITWSFLRYPKYPSFENTTTNVTQRAAYNSSYKIESVVTMPVEVSGKIKCEACNTLGCDSKNETILVSDGLGAFGIIGPRKSVVKGENIYLICASSVYNYMNNFTWTVRVNQTEKPVNKTERLTVVQHRTSFTYRSMLKINNVQKSDAQDYFCTGEIMNTSNQETLNSLSNRATYTLIIYDPILPFFNETNLNRTKIRYIDVITEGHITIILKCFAKGMPKPTVTWYKDSVLLKESDQCLFKYNYQELHIKYMMPHDSGKYLCRAISRLGTNETYQQITVKDTTWYTLDIILVSSIPILGFILLIIAIFFTIKFHREKKIREELLVPDLICFDGEYLTPSPTTENKEQFLLYDKKLEFPRERVKLKKQLDSGYFGVVMRAEALGICKNETVTIVAVKMVRQSDDTTYLRALVSELKIMLHLGKHLNVVNLLGACTKNILKGELLVILEYCSFGNLHKHLLRHRNNFIDQIDFKTGKLDLTIDIVKKTVNVSNDNSTKSDIDVVQYCSETNTDTSEINALSNCVSSSNSWQSNFCGNYKILHQNINSICTQDLLSWAFQVAHGMEYLSQRKVLHGDLAARNILLAKDNVVKICDFGLAKNIYKDYYKKRGRAPVPVKWMAIESIGDHVFSTQSDVWSFGIMLWEFFILAKEPYPGTEAEKLYQKLIEGYRMEQPDYANREIYDVMLQCWEAKPALRPSFTNLVESIGNLLEESVKMHFIELNTPYMDMNKKNLSTSKNNSLIMTSEPDHAVFSLSANENSQFPKDISNSLHVHVNPGSSTDSEIMTELSPMLKHKEDVYLNSVNVHKRRVKFIRQRQMENLIVDRLME